MASVGGNGEQHADVVAKHYNDIKESGLEDRIKSRIFYLRNFNNWIKSMLINEYLLEIKRNREHGDTIAVLDMCSGKGGDLLKWKKGNIHKLVCADIAGTAVEQCEQRYKEMVDRNKQERYSNRLFSAECLTADCTTKRLRTLYNNPDIRFDLTSCQFSFHYSFESYSQADMMVRNACENLRVGGYFIGTTPNSYEIVKRLRRSENQKFGNEVFSVTYNGPDDYPLFGAKYDFHLEGVVDCPEFLVYFPAFEEIAKKYGMKLVLRKKFCEFFDKHITQNDGRGLIGRMQALEPYPAEEDVSLMCSDERAYEVAQDHFKRLQAEQQPREGSRNRPTKVGTLSQAEWDAATIYLVFAFIKTEDISPEYCQSAESSAPVEQSSDQEAESKE